MTTAQGPDGGSGDVAAVAPPPPDATAPGTTGPATSAPAPGGPTTNGATAPPPVAAVPPQATPAPAQRAPAPAQAAPAPAQAARAPAQAAPAPAQVATAPTEPPRETPLAVERQSTPPGAAERGSGAPQPTPKEAEAALDALLAEVTAPTEAHPTPSAPDGVKPAPGGPPPVTPAPTTVSELPPVTSPAQPAPDAAGAAPDRQPARRAPDRCHGGHAGHPRADRRRSDHGGSSAQLDPDARAGAQRRRCRARGRLPHPARRGPRRGRRAPGVGSVPGRPWPGAPRGPALHRACRDRERDLLPGPDRAVRQSAGSRVVM